MNPTDITIQQPKIPIFLHDGDSLRNEIVLVDPEISYADFKTLVKNVFARDDQAREVRSFSVSVRHEIHLLPERYYARVREDNLEAVLRYLGHLPLEVDFERR